LIMLSWLIITLGSFITALGINSFLIPNKIAAGGLTGLATVIYHLSGFPVGIAVLLMNIPLFILSIRLLGRSFGIKTFYAAVILSVFVDVFSFLPALTDDLLLACIYGGLSTGFGLGLVFRQNATTGGTDLAARLGHHYINYVSISQWLIAFDALVVILAAVIFRNYELGLYASLTIFIMARVIDTVIIGIDYNKAVYIISDKADIISRKILTDMNRGVTGLSGKGMFSGTGKEVLLCVLRKREIPHLKSMVIEIDAHAFVFLSDVREVMGEGFQENV